MTDMINKYPTIYEIQEVLNSPLITRGFINQFAQKRGVFLVNASKEDLIKELSYHLYEYTDLDEIRNLAYQSSNKQVLSGFTIISKKKNFDLENLYDRLRDFGQLQSKGYQLKAITKKKIGENVIFHGEIEYTKRKTGKIEFLQIEELVEKAMNAHELVKDPTIDQLLDIDQWARDFVLKEINETCRRL